MEFANYNRILIIGSPGSGKSTLARQLAAQTGHPLIHLDYEYWGPGWTHPTKEEWRARQEEMVRGERWIIDGNYGGTLELRFRAADLVLHLDTPRRTCLWRALKRHFANRLGVRRPDMREEVKESCLFSKEFLGFLTFIWRYPKHSLPKVLVLRGEYPEVAFVNY